MKTAVEWLENEFIKLEYSIGVTHEMYELIEEAKKIEKQQIVDAKNHGRNYKYEDGEQYYNETFKTK